MSPCGRSPRLPSRARAQARFSGPCDVTVLFNSARFHGITCWGDVYTYKYVCVWANLENRLIVMKWYSWIYVSCLNVAQNWEISQVCLSVRNYIGAFGRHKCWCRESTVPSVLVCKRVVPGTRQVYIVGVQLWSCRYRFYSKGTADRRQRRDEVKNVLNKALKKQTFSSMSQQNYGGLLVQYMK